MEDGQLERLIGGPQVRDLRIESRQLGEGDAEGTVDFYSATWGTEHEGYHTFFDEGCFTAWLEEWEHRLPICWCHDVRSCFGDGIHEEDDKGVLVHANVDLDVPLGQHVWSGLRKKYIDCASVTFNPKAWRVDDDDKLHYTEAELWESSLLPRAYSADPTAKVKADSLRWLPQFAASLEAARRDIDLRRIGDAMEELRDAMAILAGHPWRRGATSFANLPLAGRSRPWDAAAADSRVRSWAGAEEEPNSKYRKAFFWFDDDAPDQFGSYKLPFADVIGGELRAVPRGIFAGAARIDGTDVPDDDKGRIRRHMGRYYAKMREEFDDDDLKPPWERVAAIMTALRTDLRGLTDALTNVARPDLASGGAVGSPVGGDGSGLMAAIMADLRAAGETIEQATTRGEET